MHTDRDREIVAWIGALGAAGAEHVMERFAMGRSQTYARLALLVQDGFLELRAVLAGPPSRSTAMSWRNRPSRTGKASITKRSGRLRGMQNDVPSCAAVRRRESPSLALSSQRTGCVTAAR
jgi:hypothetical protein